MFCWLKPETVLLSHNLITQRMSSKKNWLWIFKFHCTVRGNFSANERTVSFLRRVVLYVVRYNQRLFFKLRTTELVLTFYLLTPWCRVLPEQLTGLQLVKKFPAFHGTRRFITALTSVRHLHFSAWKMYNVNRKSFDFNSIQFSLFLFKLIHKGDKTHRI